MALSDIISDRILTEWQADDAEYFSHIQGCDEPYDPIDDEPIDEETSARFEAAAEAYRARKVAFCFAAQEACRRV